MSDNMTDTDILKARNRRRSLEYHAAQAPPISSGAFLNPDFTIADLQAHNPAIFRPEDFRVVFNRDWPVHDARPEHAEDSLVTESETVETPLIEAQQGQQQGQQEQQSSLTTSGLGIGSRIRQLIRNVGNFLTNTTSNPTPLAPLECSICCEVIPHKRHATHLPCTHVWCRTCLHKAITLCISDESQWPPRCCTSHLPHHSIEHGIRHDRSLLRIYRARYVEWSVPLLLRHYCSNSDCGAFLPGSKNAIELDLDMLLCRECKRHTCRHCDGARHRGHCLPAEAEDVEFLEMAMREAWRRCPTCRQMVEKNEGCNIVHCRCGEVFCYICGQARVCWAH